MVALLHVLFAVLTQLALRSPEEHFPAQNDTALQMRFVPILTTPEPPPPPPPPPPPSPNRAPAHPERASREPSAQVARAATVGAPAAPAPLHLYTMDGRIVMPATGASSKAPPTPETLKGDAQVMRNYDPLHYKPTPFNQYFPPVDESAGQAVVRRIVDTLVKTKDVDLTQRLHVQCKTVLGIPTPDCHMPLPGPSPKAGDERLSMAPAGPATVVPATPKPSVAKCIDIYRAGKPLPWGCPVDTPARAVDAELKARRARTQQQP